MPSKPIYPYTFSDIVWQTVRLAALGFIMYKSFGVVEKVSFRIGQTAPEVEGNISLPVWTWKLTALSIFLGYAFYFLVCNIFFLVMKVVFKCEVLGLHDWTFLLDDDDNNHIIVAVGVFEQFDYLTMKNYLNSKSAMIDKCRSKLV